MARKIKVFGKVINDIPEAMEINDRREELYFRARILSDQKEKCEEVYDHMKGMYSSGIGKSDWEAQGFRNWYYKYEAGMERKEDEERKAYYEANIVPLTQQIKELWAQAAELNEPLCIATWGYGIEEYEARQELAKTKKKLAEAEKELSQTIAYIEELKQKITTMEEIYK